jgi:hypothetical protein
MVRDRLCLSLPLPSAVAYPTFLFWSKSWPINQMTFFKDKSLQGHLL